MNRSIIDSGHVSHEIIFNILMQRKLIQTCFKQVNSVKLSTSITEFGKLVHMLYILMFVLIWCLFVNLCQS